MFPPGLIGVAALVAIFVQAIPGKTQVRITPRQAQGGAKLGQPWIEVPESFRGLKILEWPLPTDLKRWQEVDRAKTRQILLQCLGDMPARPRPRRSRTTPKMEKTPAPKRWLMELTGLEKPGIGKVKVSTIGVQRARMNFG